MSAPVLILPPASGARFASSLRANAKPDLRSEKD